MIRKTTFVLLAVALLAFGMGGCTQYTGPNQSGGTTPGSSGKMAAGSARLTDADNGKTVDLAVGGTLVIDLEENATTGFSWATTETVPAILAVAGAGWRESSTQIFAPVMLVAPLVELVLATNAVALPA